MAAEPSVLGVIVARGGSTGLPRKNVLPLGGQPLIAWSVAAAAAARRLDRCIVSTDDWEIAEAARAAGGEVPFIRPGNLATDTASVMDALFHALDAVGGTYDHVVLLQATSPLRTGADIDACITRYLASGAPACVSMTALAKHPAWMFELTDGGRLQPILGDLVVSSRRQDLPAAYAPNGAVYIAGVEWLRITRSFYSPETLAYIMPPERSVDIDTAFDLRIAEALAPDRRS